MNAMNLDQGWDDLISIFGDGGSENDASAETLTKAERYATIDKYIGRKFNMLLVVGVAARGISGKLICRCDCGSERAYWKSKIVQGKTKSCGCLNASIIPPGTKFVSWTVIEKLFVETGGKGRYYFRCQCDCGVVSLVDGVSLKNGHSRSCGCIRDIERTLPNGEASFRSILDGYQRHAKERHLPLHVKKIASHSLGEEIYQKVNSSK